MGIRGAGEYARGASLSNIPIAFPMGGVGVPIPFGASGGVTWINYAGPPTSTGVTGPWVIDSAGAYWQWSGTKWVETTSVTIVSGLVADGGVTDNAPIINTVITGAAAQGAGRVVIPYSTGSYGIGSDITVPTGVILAGQGTYKMKAPVNQGYWAPTTGSCAGTVLVPCNAGVGAGFTTAMVVLNGDAAALEDISVYGVGSWNGTAVNGTGFAGTSGTNTLTIANTTGLAVGQSIRDTTNTAYIPQGTVIGSITANTSVTLVTATSYYLYGAAHATASNLTANITTADTISCRPTGQLATVPVVFSNSAGTKTRRSNIVSGVLGWVTANSATDCNVDNDTYIAKQVNLGIVGQNTTVAAGSNTGVIANIASWGTPGAGQLAVAASTNFKAGGGNAVVQTSAGWAFINYTGVGAGLLTGCTFICGLATATVATGYTVNDIGVACTASGTTLTLTGGGTCQSYGIAPGMPVLDLTTQAHLTNGTYVTALPGGPGGTTVTINQAAPGSFSGTDNLLFVGGAPILVGSADCMIGSQVRTEGPVCLVASDSGIGSLTHCSMPNSAVAPLGPAWNVISSSGRGGGNHITGAIIDSGNGSACGLVLRVWGPLNIQSGRMINGAAASFPMVTDFGVDTTFGGTTLAGMQPSCNNTSGTWSAIVAYLGAASTGNALDNISNFNIPTNPSGTSACPTPFQPSATAVPGVVDSVTIAGNSPPLVAPQPSSPSNSANWAGLSTPAATNGGAGVQVSITQDAMVYLQVGTAGTAFSLSIGHTSGASDVTLISTAVATAGELISFRLPAGWYYKWSATTATLAQQKAVAC